MTTSIDDLLSVLERETFHSADLHPLDSARALAWCGRLLERLRGDGIGADVSKGRDDTARRLADACDQAAIAFGGDPGRCSDLVAVVSDAVGRLRRDLTDSDRWTIAIRLAVPARRWAEVILDSGPYSKVPQLLSVLDRSGELLRVACSAAPDPADLRGHDIPISGPVRWFDPDFGRDVTGAVADLAGELCRQSTDRLTVRELVAVCHAAARVAEYIQEPLYQRPRTREGAAGAWSDARDILTLFRDGTDRRPTPSARLDLVHRALVVETAVRHAESQTQVAPMTTPSLRLVARRLEQVAERSAAELKRLRTSLLVPRGSRPLSESRVGEWLRKETFAVTPPDLVPALHALHAARMQSVQLAVNRPTLGRLTESRMCLTT